MKIALLPDLHCFYNTNGKMENGKSIRETEWENCAQKVLDVCKKQKVKIAIAPGDFFVNSRPTANQVLKIAKLFEDFEHSGIKVVGINGNHDVGSVGFKNMNDVVKEIGTENWCYDSPTAIEIDGIGFVLLPFMKEIQIETYRNSDSESIDEILTNKAQELLKTLKSETKILVGHYAISSAKMSNDKEVVGEIVLNKNLLTGFDACLFGHIHKKQIVSKEPLIAYSGALQRTNLGEANDDRGFYIFDTETKKLSDHKIPAIEMVNYTTRIENEKDIERFLNDIEKLDLKDKIVSFKYEISSKDIALVENLKIYNMVKAKQPKVIVNITPIIIQKNVNHNAVISESTNNAVALKKWMKKQNYSDDDYKKVMEFIKKYDEEDLA